MISDEEIKSYINVYYMEMAISHEENTLLMLLKLRQEKFPSEKNDNEWLSFSDWVLKRRL